MTLHSPVGKDQQRIYDIVKKSVPAWAPADPSLAPRAALVKLATSMNDKITSEEKRRARFAACVHYGMPWLAECFSAAGRAGSDDEAFRHLRRVRRRAR